MLLTVSPFANPTVLLELSDLFPLFVAQEARLAIKNMIDKRLANNSP